MTTTEFNNSIRLYSGSLRNHALTFTRDADDADDLLQDTFVKAIRFMDRFEDGTNLKGWLFVIMRNTFLNSYRKKAKEKTNIVQEEEISSASLMKSSVKNDATGAFMMGDIKKALDNLSETYSVPFIRYFEGYKYEEIALELKIPLGTVKTRIHQARLMLKKYLKQYQTS